jgi:hypothetical protein
MVDRTPKRKSRPGESRGQAYTLEGVISAVLILTALLLATTAVAITPTTAGTIDRDTMAQLGTQTDDVLSAAHERDALREAALFWNTQDGQSGWPTAWQPGDDCPETVENNSLTLCVLLEETFTSRFYRYNVYLDYQTERKTTETEPLYVQGTPGRNAVTASRSLALHDGMELTHGPEGTLGENVSQFYADDLDDPTFVNVVEIRVVVW